MKTLSKGTTVYTSNLQPGEDINIDFFFYKVNSICGFISMLTAVCAKNIMLWILPTASKKSPVWIIRFILITANNEQQPCKRVRVDRYGALEKSTDVTNLLVEEFKISMETTGGDAYWLNGKNEKHNRIIHNIVRSGLIYSNKHENKWFCTSETSTEAHRWKSTVD